MSSNEKRAEIMDVIYFCVCLYGRDLQSIYLSNIVLHMIYNLGMLSELSLHSVVFK